MNTRLKQFLAAENITQAQFADNINVVRASVSHVLSGRNNPSYEFIRSITLKYPRLNIEWLLFGKGKMYKDAYKETVKETAEEDQSTEIGVLFPEPVPYHEEIAPTNVIETLDKAAEPIVNQRKVSKIIVLFDDGTFQEM